MNDQATPALGWVITGSPPRRPPVVTGNPALLIDLALAPGLSITIMVQMLRKSGLTMRLPMSHGGGDGVMPSEDVRDAMLQAVLASVRACPEAVAHLQTPHPCQRQKVGGKKRTAGGATA